METKVNSNPVLNFRKELNLENQENKFESDPDKKSEPVLSAQGTMITETREQIDTSEISG